MKFFYQARAKTGKIEKGNLEAPDRAAAVSVLKSRELTVLLLNQDTTFQFLAGLFPPHVSHEEKIIFTRELALMIRSGLPIAEALRALQLETENKQFAAIIQELIIAVQGGKSLSQSIAMHANIFGEIYVSTLESGEVSGKIDVVLDRLATQLEKNYDLKRKVKGALTYPVFVLVSLFAVMSLIMTTIIPQLKTIFDDADVPLPILTLTVINIGVMMKKYGLLILLIILILAVLLWQWNKTTSGRWFFDSFKLKIPIIGTLLKKSYIADFSRTFASLSASGLPLLDVFHSSGKVIGNVLYEKEVLAMTKEIENGESISKAFSKSRLFPKTIAQMSMVGEKSGNIDEVFSNLAGFYERDVEVITANISTMLEPILMVVMGVGIGLIIISVLQPIYGLVNAI